MNKKYEELRAKAYAALRALSRECEDYREAQMLVGSAETEASLRRKTVRRSIDTEWVEKIEAALPSLDIIVRRPTVAIEDVEEYIPIDVSLLGYGEYFGLVARGDSMIDAGIHDGDTVYVRKQNTAFDGEIVVAMVEDECGDGWSATLKRFYRDVKNSRYILHPENSRLDDIIVDKVHVVGVAVRVLKNLEAKRRPC